jgi:signal transduction histidine kinase
MKDIILQELFEQVPFNVAVIDRDFNIVQANNNFLDYFGNWQDKKCYAVYKKLKEPCRNCPAVEVFKTGKAIVADAAGIDKYGRKTHYVGHVLPVTNKENSNVDFVMEMTRTVTETDRWQQEYQILFERVPCYITVIGEDYRIVRANEAFRENFGDVLGQLCYKVYKRRKTKCRNCPAAKTFKDGKVHRSTQHGIGKRGQEIHYSVTTSALIRGGENVAHVIEISDDITLVKQLENKIIEAERLSAVGQTVAGLAHSIKNMLMGLEGGMYMVDVGLKKGDADRIVKGWDILQRNFEKTTALVKDFLSFSKGRLPELQLVQPNKLVENIIDLYGATARQQGVELKFEADKKIKQAYLDPNGIETCLTNIISNGIDACLLRKEPGGRVLLRTREEKGQLIFESIDNGCGIDLEVKQKMFTTFFTTKGGKGTGLGLLTTRKIVQEHGGQIEVKSTPGGGSTFRIRLLRKRLEILAKQMSKKNKKTSGSLYE